MQRTIVNPSECNISDCTEINVNTYQVMEKIVLPREKPCLQYNHTLVELYELNTIHTLESIELKLENL